MQRRTVCETFQSYFDASRSRSAFISFETFTPTRMSFFWVMSCSSLLTEVIYRRTLPTGRLHETFFHSHEKKLAGATDCTGNALAGAMDCIGPVQRIAL